jgi:hypothetical protein
VKWENGHQANETTIPWKDLHLHLKEDGDTFDDFITALMQLYFKV